MSRMFLVAMNDLRLFLRDKAAYFWLFGSPLLFAFFMGFANRTPGGPANPKPSVAIENLDQGFLSKLLIDELGVQGLRVSTNREQAVRGIRIPAGFTEKVLKKESVKAELFQTKGSGDEAASMIELKVVRAMVALNSYLIEHASKGTSPTAEELELIRKKPNPVELKATFGTRKPVPSGPRQAVPGILVMFVMMNLLIFGGATVASERREGVLKRLMVQPILLRELVFGKILGLLCLGAVQIVFLLIAARWLMQFRIGENVVWVLLLLAVYSSAAAAFGVFIGSIISREDKVVGLCVLASMVMAAMGGCWWPLEIVPENLRVVGHLFPTAWAMDGLHQLISFGGGFAEIREELAVLAGYAAAGSFAAIRFFRV
jgi:ABC-2 type transport system permease protein